MDTLNLRSKLDYYILIAIIQLFGSCVENTMDKRLHDVIFSKCIEYENYQDVYKQANDSINKWISFSLESVKMQTYALQWKLDTLLCFNSSSNKCIGIIMSRESQTVNNSLNYFFGVKIEDRWHFFYGATIYLFNEYYNLPPDTPMSFAKLHEIAMKEVFRGYLIETVHKKDLGWFRNTFLPEYVSEFRINDRWFDQIGTERNYVHTKQDSLRMTPSLLDSLLILKAYSNWLPSSLQNISYTARSKWEYFYKTPYPLSVPWE